MMRILIATSMTLLLAASYPAAAEQAAQIAALPDPSEFEITAVAPRNPDAKPILSSIPMQQDRPLLPAKPGQDDRPDALGRPVDGVAVKPNP